MRNPKIKKILLFLLGGVVAIWLLSFAADTFLEKKIKDIIAVELPSDLDIGDYKLSVSTRSGSLFVENVSLSAPRASDSISVFSISKIELNGLSYLSYLFKNTISFKEVFIQDFHGNLLGEGRFFQKVTADDNQNIFDNKSLLIKNVRLKNMNMIVHSETHQQPNLQLENLELALKNFRVDQKSLPNKIPFDYEHIDLKIAYMSSIISDYEILSFENLQLKDRKIALENFTIKTLFEKAEYSKILPNERDHFDLKIPKVTFENFDFGNQSESFFVESDMMVIREADFKVYRDKLVADDKSIKPLYSEAIRSLPFYLTVDSLKIHESQIVYQEKVKDDLPPGEINFTAFNASITNFSNTYLSGEKTTNINVNTIFMGKTPLEVDWVFDVQDTEDTFVFRAQLQELNAAHISSFSKPSLNVVFEGELHHTFFTIHGNNNDSQIDMRLSFDDFKVELLGRDQKKKGLLSALANVFVNTSSLTKQGEYKNVKAHAVRNKDKSVFNFMWISIEAALKKALIAI